MSKILVRVVEGECQGGYRKIGDTFEVDYDDALTPQGLCFGAFGSIHPYIMILLGNGEFHWEEARAKTRL